jgi:hypothetical protein
MPKNMGFSFAMLDTHAAVKKLTKAGLSEDAAEAIVQVQLKTLHQGLTTKEDLFRAASAIKEGLNDYRVETERRFSSLEGSLNELRVETEKRFTILEGNLSDYRVETERRFSSLEARMSRLTFLVWIILAIVALTNPIAARVLERILGVPL